MSTVSIVKTLKSQPKIEYPFVSESKFGKVKIYLNELNGKPLYVVSWLTMEGRKRQSYTEESAAHQRLEELMEDYKLGRLARRDITTEKAMLLASYEESLKPYGATIGDAVTFFLAHRGKEAENHSMAEDAIKEYLKVLRGDERKEESLHSKTARSILRQFGRAFGKTLDRITASELKQYLEGVSESGRTRNNHLNYVRGFFRWAQKWKKYLPSGELQVDLVKEFPEERKSVRDMIFTPDQMRRLLEAADADMIPPLAIGAFAGVRNCEIGKMEWEEIDLEEKVIEIPAHKSKVGLRRLVTIHDNLAAWLRSYVGEKKGRLVPFPKSVYKKNRRAARGASTEADPVEWKPNALRKSYISYRMAEADSDQYQVAKQCGNSPKMVEQNYKQLVKPQAAKDWFALYPTKNK